MPKGYRVARVAGRMILDPHSIGRTHRRIGYERVLAGEVRHPITGGLVPHESWREGPEEPEGHIVIETTDYFFRRAIVAGDLDYLGSVSIAPDGITATPDDAPLALATKQNRATRAALEPAPLPARAVGSVTVAETAPALDPAA